MTIEIPDDLARELTRVGAAQQKTVVELALDRLRSTPVGTGSPQSILEFLRRLPHPTPAAVDDLEAAIAGGRQDRVVTSVVVRGE